MLLENLSERIVKGLVTVSRAGDAYKVVSKRFDPLTGDELPPDEVSFDLDLVQRDIDERQAGIDGIKALLAEAKKL